MTKREKHKNIFKNAIFAVLAMLYYLKQYRVDFEDEYRVISLFSLVFWDELNIVKCVTDMTKIYFFAFYSPSL